MQRYIYKVIKLFILFLCCSLLFYFALKSIHDEYERYHRYDEPQGATVKVFLEEHDVLDYIYLFFRLGE